MNYLNEADKVYKLCVWVLQAENQNITLIMFDTIIPSIHVLCIRWA